MHIAKAVFNHVKNSILGRLNILNPLSISLLSHYGILCKMGKDTAKLELSPLGKLWISKSIGLNNEILLYSSQ